MLIYIEQVNDANRSASCRSPRGSIINTYKTFGAKGVVSAVYHSFVPRRAKCLPLVREMLNRGRGLEVGGPSNVFRATGELPLYPGLPSLDNCNFSQDTIWEGEITEGASFHYDAKREPGHQYISEASVLSEVPIASYDFLMSSHALEHMANPIKGLAEWIRVLKDEGVLLLLLPHRERTFDHNRPVTTLSHLIVDFDNDTGEDDLTHLQEILKLHDLQRDPEAGSAEAFKQRSKDNFNNRCLHHHVFDNELVVQLLTHMKMQIHSLENVLPLHIIAVARKVADGKSPDNSQFLESEPPRWV